MTIQNDSFLGMVLFSRGPFYSLILNCLLSESVAISDTIFASVFAFSLDCLRQQQQQNNLTFFGPGLETPVEKDCVHAIPESFCAGMKPAMDRPFGHTWTSNFGTILVPVCQYSVLLIGWGHYLSPVGQLTGLLWTIGVISVQIITYSFLCCNRKSIWYCVNIA